MDMYAWKSVKLYGGAIELYTYILSLGILAPSVYPPKQGKYYTQRTHTHRQRRTMPQSLHSNWCASASVEFALPDMQATALFCFSFIRSIACSLAHSAVHLTYECAYVCVQCKNKMKLSRIKMNVMASMYALCTHIYRVSVSVCGDHSFARSLQYIPLDQRVFSTVFFYLLDEEGEATEIERKKAKHVPVVRYCRSYKRWVDFNPSYPTAHTHFLCALVQSNNKNKRTPFRVRTNRVRERERDSFQSVQCILQ